jgi:CDP-glycerol glycerophosphotransferase (TagB/SpsB family)
MGESTYLIVSGLQVPREFAWAVRSVHEHEVSAFLAASDVVISDYSSLIGDAAARDVPVIIFQPDREVFVDRMHGLYPGVEVFGSPLLFQTDLHASVTSILTDLTGAREAQRPAREAFLADHVGYRDGHAGERAVAALMGLR